MVLAMHRKIVHVSDCLPPKNSSWINMEETERPEFQTIFIPHNWIYQQKKHHHISMPFQSSKTHHHPNVASIDF